MCTKSVPYGIKIDLLTSWKKEKLDVTLLLEKVLLIKHFSYTAFYKTVNVLSLIVNYLEEYHLALVKLCGCIMDDADTSGRPLVLAFF